MKKKERTYPIECKASLGMDQRHLRGMKDYLDLYHQDTGIVASLAPYSVHELSKQRKIVNLPVYLAERLTGSELETSLGSRTAR